MWANKYRHIHIGESTSATQVTYSSKTELDSAIVLVAEWWIHIPIIVIKQFFCISKGLAASESHKQMGICLLLMRQNKKPQFLEFLHSCTLEVLPGASSWQSMLVTALKWTALGDWRLILSATQHSTSHIHWVSQNFFPPIAVLYVLAKAEGADLEPYRRSTIE